MGYNIGMPCLKLNTVGAKSKHCGSFSDVSGEALEERKGRDKDIVPELSYLNEYTGFRTAAELVQYSDEHVKELSEKQRSEGKRGIRNDAVRMVATVIKPPAELMEQMNFEKQREFLAHCNSILAEIIGAERIKSTVMHFDEVSPHLHVFWEPMTDDGRLCCKDVLNLKMYQKINREMPKRLREYGYDIEDCKMYDQAEEERIVAEKMEAYLQEHDAAPEELQSIKEKLKEERYQEVHQKRGRSSAVFKGDIKKENVELLAQKKELEQEISSLEAHRADLVNGIDKEIENIRKIKLEALERELEGIRENKIQEIIETVFGEARNRIYEALKIIPMVEVEKEKIDRDSLFEGALKLMDKEDQNKFGDLRELSPEDRKYIEEKYLCEWGTFTVFDSYGRSTGKSEKRFYKPERFHMAKEKLVIDDFLALDKKHAEEALKPHSIGEVLRKLKLSIDLKPIDNAEKQVLRGRSR